MGVKASRIKSCCYQLKIGDYNSILYVRLIITTVKTLKIYKSKRTQNQNTSLKNVWGGN
jgi:hypothetical protein